MTPTTMNPKISHYWKCSIQMMKTFLHLLQLLILIMKERKNQKEILAMKKSSNEDEEEEKQPENELMDEYESLWLDCMTLEDQITSRDSTMNGLKEKVKNPELSHKGKILASELQSALEEDIK
ncbi:hypothetical protein RDI58_013443 [Solanum bulbocastanum]|uniref:Uncharacterized protein n=1 Tax=Solanum bulbocastanum TaxID=147425 RepID=A0AAN8YHR0_SOLBU